MREGGHQAGVKKKNYSKQRGLYEQEQKAVEKQMWPHNLTTVFTSLSIPTTTQLLDGSIPVFVSISRLTLCYGMDYNPSLALFISTVKLLYISDIESPFNIYLLCLLNIPPTFFEYFLSFLNNSLCIFFSLSFDIDLSSKGPWYFFSG